jgi:hypothetical protein
MKSVIISGLLEYFRNLYILAVDEQTSELIDLPGEDIATMKSYLKYYQKRDVNNVLILLSKLYLDVKNCDLAQELFEITLMKLTHYREIIHPATLIRRLEELRQDALGSGEVLQENGNNGEVGPDETIEGQELTEAESSVQNPDFLPEIISHFSKKRRAIAEFLNRAVDCRFENNLLTFVYDSKEKLSYEHVSEESVQRYIESEIKELLQSDLRLQFVINIPSQREVGPSVSSEVSKVLEIFKGEIVNRKKAGDEAAEDR